MRYLQDEWHHYRGQVMIFLGVAIGGIVLCMFLPIFKMGEIVSA